MSANKNVQDAGMDPSSRWGDSVGMRVRYSTPDQALRSSAYGLEVGEGELAALNSECLCFSGRFSVRLSSLMPSIITVQMMRFLAPLPSGYRSLAFPVLTRK